MYRVFLVYTRRDNGKYGFVIWQEGKLLIASSETLVSTEDAALEKALNHLSGGSKKIVIISVMSTAEQYYTVIAKVGKK